MNLKSKTASLLLLGITAVTGSRILFFVFNDPEGPNLVVVLGAALIVYLASLPVYLLNYSATSSKRLLLAILVQVVAVAGLYLALR